MPVFTYTARDQSGNQTQGTLEADSNQRAAALLRERGLWVTDLRPSGRSPGAARPEAGSTLKQLFNPVPLKDLALFYRQLHTMIQSGMALYHSLELLSGPNQTPNPHLRRVLGELARQVLAGGRLSERMAVYPWLFDKLQIRMIQAGEEGGLLVEVLERLARYLEREYEIRLEIKRRTLYPKLLLAALILIPPVPILVLQGPIPYVIAIWGRVAAVALVAIPLFFVIRYMLTTQGGRQLYDQIKLAVPVVGPLVRKLAAGRFARAMAALYSAGVPIASALRLSGEASGNSVLERDVATMVPAVERGVSISQCMSSSKFFPPMIVGMVNTGESSGNMDTMLDKAAEFYENETAHTIQQAIVIVGVILFLIMAVLIAIQVISSYGAMFSRYGSEMGE